MIEPFDKGQWRMMAGYEVGQRVRPTEKKRIICLKDDEKEEE